MKNGEVTEEVPRLSDVGQGVTGWESVNSGVGWSGGAASTGAGSGQEEHADASLEREPAEPEGGGWDCLPTDERTHAWLQGGEGVQGTGSLHIQNEEELLRC